MELPTLRFFTLLIDPCGLWHEEHDILPSRTGMCATARSVFTTCTRWQRGAHLRLGRLHQLALPRLRRVHAVARGAAEIPRGVGAGLPACVSAAVVAGETRVVDLAWLQFLEFLDLPFRVVVDVRLARTMAALAAERGCGRAGILGLPVLRVRDALCLCLMTDDAGIRSGVARRQRGRRRLRGRRLRRRRLRRRCLRGRRLRGWLLRDWLPRIDEAARGHAEPDDQGESEEELVPIHVGSLQKDEADLALCGRRITHKSTRSTRKRIIDANGSRRS